VKRTLLVVPLLALLLLTACQAVVDTRTQACNTMRDANERLKTTQTAVMDSQPAQTVGELRATILSVRTTVQTAQVVLPVLKDGGGALQIMRALDQMEAETKDAPDNAPLSQFKDKLSGPVQTAQSSTQSAYDAVCAAK
jgi:outer membrane biogenesis lipoprotein LolB